MITCDLVVLLPFCLGDKVKINLIHLLYALSASSPESGLSSDRLKKKRSVRALQPIGYKQPN